MTEWHKHWYVAHIDADKDPRLPDTWNPPAHIIDVPTETDVLPFRITWIKLHDQ